MPGRGGFDAAPAAGSDAWLSHAPGHLRRGLAGGAGADAAGDAEPARDDAAGRAAAAPSGELSRSAATLAAASRRALAGDRRAGAQADLQEHPPGLQALSDFTDGVPRPHHPDRLSA